MCRDSKSCITINCGCCGGGTGGGVDTGAENVYSLEETVCGTWIDGKPIYRKVITGTIPTGNGDGATLLNVGELQVERLVGIYGSLEDNLHEEQVTIQTSYNLPSSIGAAINMWYHMPSQNIRYHFLNNEGRYSGGTVYVVLEYTKK